MERSITDWRPRVRFRRQDARTWTPPPDGYDLIATHFFLDCFVPAEAAALVGAIAEAANPGAVWLVADFCLPERGYRRWRAKAWVAILYWACRALTGIGPGRVPDYPAMLRGAGFFLEAERRCQAGMLLTQIWRRGENA